MGYWINKVEEDYIENRRGNRIFIEDRRGRKRQKNILQEINYKRERRFNRRQKRKKMMKDAR